MKEACNDNLPNSSSVQGGLTKEATLSNKQHLCEEDSAFQNAHFAESSEPQESSLLQQSIESKNPSGKKRILYYQSNFLFIVYVSPRSIYVEIV